MSGRIARAMSTAILLLAWSLDAMRPLYARDPFDFGIGESTHDEMCFFVGFAIGDDTFSGADCPGLWENLIFL